jgi:hypothetical protein
VVFPNGVIIRSCNNFQVPNMITQGFFPACLGGEGGGRGGYVPNGVSTNDSP